MAMFTINRAGKQLGPYSLGDVQRYLAEGRLGLNEPACLNGDQKWQPLQRLMAAAGPVQPTKPHMPPVNPTKVEHPRTQGPVPPSLHWFLILVLSSVSGGLFGFIWLFVQSSFVKKIDAASKATAYFAFGLGCVAVYVVGYLGLQSQLENGIGLNDSQTLALLMAFVCVVAACVLFLMGIYSIRSSMQTYYRDVEPLGTTYTGEPIGLRMSGVLTFFFNVYYIQYHFSKIAKWKELGVLY